MLELISGSAPIFIAVVFAFTLLIGSFLNVVIHRLPIMMEREWREQAEELTNTPPEQEPPEGRFDLVIPRSRCPSCGVLITAMQNIPVISYLFLRGRCANCKTSISARYPLVELMTAILHAIQQRRLVWILCSSATRALQVHAIVSPLRRGLPTLVFGVRSD